MPELPEVETIVRDLRPALVGRRVVGVETDWPKYFLFPKTAAAFKRRVIGRTITASCANPLPPPAPVSAPEPI